MTTKKDMPALPARIKAASVAGGFYSETTLTLSDWIFSRTAFPVKGNNKSNLATLHVKQGSGGAVRMTRILVCGSWD